MKASTVKRLLNWWPPLFLGPGIRVNEMSDDFRYAKVSMPLTFYNRNYIGTHYGGSLYSMCDPMYMILLLNGLGRDYIVWDKSATIEYRKPGRGTVTAEFFVSDELFDSLKAMEPGEKRLVDLGVDVKDEAGDIVAHLVKTLYTRRKAQEESDSPPISQL